MMSFTWMKPDLSFRGRRPRNLYHHSAASLTGLEIPRYARNDSRRWSVIPRHEVPRNLWHRWVALLAAVKAGALPQKMGTSCTACVPRFARNDNSREWCNVSKQYYVYLMASKSHVLYVGLTNDLQRRVEQHKQKLVEGFTARYNITRLVYYEVTNDVHVALAREKEIKGWRRSKKVALIESVNPTWRDLSDDWHE